MTANITVWFRYVSLIRLMPNVHLNQNKFYICIICRFSINIIVSQSSNNLSHAVPTYYFSIWTVHLAFFVEAYFCLHTSRYTWFYMFRIFRSLFVKKSKSETLSKEKEHQFNAKWPVHNTRRRYYTICEYRCSMPYCVKKYVRILQHPSRTGWWRMPTMFILHWFLFKFVSCLFVYWYNPINISTNFLSLVFSFISE